MYKDLAQKLKETESTPWDEAFQHLSDYRKENTNTLVPQFYSTDDGFTLGFWLLKLRQDRANGLLTEDQINRLDELKFVWDPHEPHWEKGFAELQKYKEQFGDSLVPENYLTEGDHYELGDFARAQRLTEGNYPREKYQRLCTVDYVWDLREYDWKRALAALELYKQENGDCLVPADYVTDEESVTGEIALGQWVIKQRIDMVYSWLTEANMLKLDALGFDWTPESGEPLHLHLYKKND